MLRFEKTNIKYIAFTHTAHVYQNAIHLTMLVVTRLICKSDGKRFQKG